MITEKVKTYRQKHRKCSYCRHIEYNEGGCGYCRAKCKLIGDSIIDMSDIPRPFCQCYEVRE